MYKYAEERHVVFTERGQRMFLAIRDEAERLLKLSGAVTAAKLMVGGGDSFAMLACIDRLVELGELTCVYSCPPSQGYVYVSGRE